RKDKRNVISKENLNLAVNYYNLSRLQWALNLSLYDLSCSALPAAFAISAVLLRRVPSLSACDAGLISLGIKIHLFQILSGNSSRKDELTPDLDYCQEGNVRLVSGKKTSKSKLKIVVQHDIL